MNSCSFSICGATKHMPVIPNVSPILVWRRKGLGGGGRVQ
jgi:hypothetical protein